MDGDLTEGLLRKSSDESSGKRRESPPPLSPSSRDITKNPTASSDSSTSGDSTDRAPVRDKSKNHQEVSAASEGKQGTVSTGEEEDKDAAASLARREAAAASAARREAAAAASAARREAEMGFFYFPSFFGGGSTSEAGGGSSGGAVSSRAEHLIDIRPPAPSKGAADLIHRAELLSDYWTDPILAGPSADLTVELQAFAAAPDATTAARLEQAAAALDSVASSNTGDAAVAKQLSNEAAALAAGWRGDNPTGQGSSAFEAAAGQREPEAPAACHSTEFLLSAVISGSVALLPYLPTQVPKKPRRVFAILFGIAFFLASVAAMLLVAPVHKRAANIIAGVSFATFTVLVMAFVGFALGGGYIQLIPDRYVVS